MISRINLIAAAGFALAFSVAMPGVAGAEDQKSDAEHCVSLRRIDRTEIVDDRNILFHMRGDEVYLNRLPHKCPGLRSNDPLMYRSAIGQLCDLDIITILHDSGFGFRSGPSCGLGMFHPISETEAQQLTADRDEGD